MVAPNPKTLSYIVIGYIPEKVGSPGSKYFDIRPMRFNYTLDLVPYALHLGTHFASKKDDPTPYALSPKALKP